MQITDRIHALKIPFQITDPSGQKVPRFVYVYLIYGKRICLIDSGVASSEKIILDYLQETGRRPEEISQLILTHSHPDHMGAARAIKSISGCTVAAHAAEKSWIEDVDLQERERPVPGFKSLVAGSVHVDQTLQDGDLLDLDGVSMQVLQTPGHSSGSICLWLPEVGALFSADAVPVPGSMPSTRTSWHPSGPSKGSGACRESSSSCRLGTSHDWMAMPIGLWRRGSGICRAFTIRS